MKKYEREYVFAKENQKPSRKIKKKWLGVGF
jgi:hypothetical protein